MEEFRTCPNCSYGRGFHVAFQAAEQGHRIVLICPGCGQSFKLGWVIPELAQPQAGANYR